MSNWDLFYYYTGKVVSWLALVGGSVFVGIMLADAVHDMGGWKAWAIDFFGLEEHK